MATCPHCGLVVRQGAAICPRCGAPLAPEPPIDGAGGREHTMPTWLRSLQQAASGNGPGAPGAPGAPGWPAPADAAGAAPAQSGFSVGSLISEDALPDWMRGGAAGPRQPAAGSAPPPGQWPPAAPPLAAPPAPWPPAARPATQSHALFDDAALPDWLRAAAAGQAADMLPTARHPTPAPGGAFAPDRAADPRPGMAPGGVVHPLHGPGQGSHIPAQSLLDANALPPWLGGTGAEPAAPEGPGGGLAASSLVDERALPPWLRQGAGQPSPEAPPAGAVQDWLAAPVTDEPLPTWLSEVYVAAQVPRAEPSAPVPPPWPSPPPAGGGPGEGALAAGQLVDDSALPDWLRAQAAWGAAPPPGEGSSGFGADPAPMGGGPAGAFGATPGFSASDLIDPGAMPDWVRQEQAAREPVFSSSHGWTSGPVPPGPMAPGADMPGAPGRGGTYDTPGDWTAAGFNPTGVDARAAFDTTGGWTAAGLRADAPVDEAELPPWLRAGAPPGRDGGYDPAPDESTSKRWVPPERSALPESQLPPWLQGGAAAPRAAAPGPGPATAAPRGDYAAPGPAAAGPGAGLYADRFRDEIPGRQRPFGYAYDHGEAPEEDDPAPAAPPEPGQESPRKGRRRWFGRG